MASFVPKAREQPTPLRRQRPYRGPDYVCFGPESDGFTAYLSREILTYIQQHLLLAAPNETVGLLAGRPCVDQEGPYTVICAVESALAEEVEATPGFIRFSGQAQAQIRARLERAHPALEVMGWYHTHPAAPACFSAEDFQEQTTWPGDHHLGVVAGQAGKKGEISVYRGPAGHLLTPPQYVWREEQDEAEPQQVEPTEALWPGPEQNPHFIIHAVVQGLGEAPQGARQLIPVEALLIAFLFMLLPGLLIGTLVFWLLNGVAR